MNKMNEKLILVAILASSFIFSCLYDGGNTNDQPIIEHFDSIVDKSNFKLKKYSGCEELKGFFDEIAGDYLNNTRSSRNKSTLFTRVSHSSAASSVEANSIGTEYSTTNVQVEGIDEADIVKTDGDYIYHLINKYNYSNYESISEIVLVKANPASELKEISRISLSYVAREMVLYNDRIVVFSESYTFSEWGTIVEIFDISDKESPYKERRIFYEGNYVSSRLIDNNLHIVLSSNTKISEVINDNLEDDSDSWWIFSNGKSDEDILNIVKDSTIDELLPLLVDSKYDKSGVEERQEKRICESLYRQSNSPKETISTIISLDLSADKPDLNLSSIMGYSGTLYASRENIYLTGNGFFDTEAGIYRESTAIHKFKLESNPPKAVYESSGEVDGYLLNQFSMDEYEGYLRIATTENNSYSSNNLFILDSNLNKTGEIRRIAEGESIYSARFIGKRGYIVTFREIDPLFTIDLSDPTNPKIEGILEISGYSGYIHPIDENHILTLGEETNVTGGSLKLDLYDISNFSSPTLAKRIVIGKNGSYSEALYDHKAFALYNGILSLPVSVYTESYYSSYTLFDGFMLFSVTSENIEKIGKIEHQDLVSDSDYYYDYYGDYSYGKRTVFINNNIYTISQYGIMVFEDSNLSKPISSLPF